MTDNVQRLHRALVDAMRKSRGDDFETPITVSQIYQELVPYRVARGSVGFEMNADYEFTLLRLLAGDGDLARLEPAEVRTMLAKEAESPNPNVSLFRAYANCDVWVTPPEDWIAEIVGGPDTEEFEVAFEPEPDHEPEPEPDSEPEAAGEFEQFIKDVMPSAEAAPAPGKPVAPRPAEPPKAAAAPKVPERTRFEAADQPVAPAAAPAAPTPNTRAPQCAFCGGNLPASRLVNFCPHCGNDLTQQPCSNCGEILEASWQFCINCGTAAGSPDAQAN
jgi:hypothetical protein